MKDMKKKGRARNRPLQGAEHGRAVLDEIDVLVIRSQAGWGVPLKELAERFGVSSNHVGLIVKRKRWAHI